MIDEKKLIDRLKRMKKECTTLKKELFFDEIIGIVETQPKIGEWISVEEKMPEKNKWVLCDCEEGGKMNELKECPFCGGKAEIKEFANGHNGNGVFTANYKVGCQKCNIYFQFQSTFVLEKGQPKFIQNGYEKCIETWNRRADNNYMQIENRKQVD